MAKKTARSVRSGRAAETGGAFPETQTEVLAQAAEGNWDLFLERYLQPCWREVVITCRSRQIPLSDAEDLYQELMLRLLRDAKFNRETQTLLAQQDQDPGFRGNLPGRYLKYRELPVRSARFRTYLKSVILNLVREATRKRQRHQKLLDDQAWRALEPWVEDSVTRSLDRRWLADCIMEAAWRLRVASDKANTPGRRRLFEILYLSTVQGQSCSEIGRKYGVSRTTISGLLSEARGRFAVLLGGITGIMQMGELKELLGDSREELKKSVARVHTDCYT